jgi:outer membrane protein assembly factor BamE (lipoprotein component of BamABCDE complex)
MRTNWILALLSATLLLTGCAISASRMNSLRLGMTKAEVIEVMGNPQSTSAKSDVEYLRYRFLSEGIFASEYFVKFQDGKVDAFGRAGDFGLGY